MVGVCVFNAGKELTVPHQLSLAGALSLPVFWLAGAGAAVFWVLGRLNRTLTDQISGPTFSLTLHSWSFVRSDAVCDWLSRCVPWAGTVRAGGAADGAGVGGVRSHAGPDDLRSASSVFSSALCGPPPSPPPLSDSVHQEAPHLWSNCYWNTVDVHIVIKNANTNTFHW